MVHKSRNQAKLAKYTFQSFHNAIWASFKQSKRIEKELARNWKIETGAGQMKAAHGTNKGGCSNEWRKEELKKLVEEWSKFYLKIVENRNPVLFEWMTLTTKVQKIAGFTFLNLCSFLRRKFLRVIWGQHSWGKSENSTEKDSMK